MENQKLKIIINLFILSFFQIMSVFAQPEKVYNLSIKDETGEEIGQYFDVKIDSIYIPSDTTLNFQLIPKIEIQDSVLKQKYSTFLEMLVRNINAEIDKRWENLTFDFSSYKYEGLDYTDRFRIVGNEINSLTSINVIKENVNANISVDYSSRDNSIISITSSDSSGNPLEGILFKKSYALDSGELTRDIRLAYLKIILLNNRVDENLLDSDCNFTIDAINLIKILNSLQNETDLDIFMNEINSSPVSIAKVNADTFFVGETVEINGSDSFDPDGSIISFVLKQLHMKPKTLEYMTEWDYSVLQDLGDGRFKVKADKPGTYWNELTVSDANGLTNSYKFPITFKNANPIGLEYKIINMLDNKENDISGVEDITYDQAAKTGADYINLVNTYWYTQVEPLPAIDRLIGHPFLQITDEFIRKNIRAIKDRGKKAMLSQSLYPADNVPMPPTTLKSQEWLDAFFEQNDSILVHQAELAEQENVDILNIYYIDLANILDPSNNVTPRFSNTLKKVREKYSGKIAISSAIDGTPDVPFLSPVYHDILRDPNIDLVFIHYNGKLYDENDPTPTVGQTSDLLKRSFKTKADGGWSLVDIINDIDKPFVLHTPWTSSARQNDFNFFDLNYVRDDVVLDYSDQVKLYEATLDVLSDPEISSVLKGIEPHGYFWNDQFDNYYPPNGAISPSSAEKGVTIRNKPAEQVIKLWFKF